MIRIDEITTIHAPVERVFDLARSIEVHLAGNTHYGEQAVAELGVTTGLLSVGDTVTWRARHFFVRQRLTSQITAFDPPRYFQDTMLRGAFHSMQHDHHFRTLPTGDTEMRDEFRFAAPIPILGPLAEALFLRRYMRALLRERNAVVKEIAESNAWQRYLPTSNAPSFRKAEGGESVSLKPEGLRPMNIVIPGGTGQVGTLLARHFHAAGHAVTVLSRNPQPAPWRTVFWNGECLGDWISTLENSDAVINLAGRSVNCRYTAANRRAILDSRVRSTDILNKAISQSAHPPAVWLNAATATIYRHALDRPMDELTGELGGNEPGAPSTWNFSIEVARAWEEAFFSTPTPRTRKVALRSAMTMSPDRGGVFDVLLSLVRRGLGGTIGPGTQYVSWIHETDFCRAVEFLITHPELDGPINLAAPNPIPNRDFMRALRQTWGTRIGLPTPAWILEMGTFLLRTESELVLKSRRVIPTRLTQADFHFLHPTWPEAARDLVTQWRQLK